MYIYFHYNRNVPKFESLISCMFYCTVICSPNKQNIRPVLLKMDVKLNQNNLFMVILTESIEGYKNYSCMTIMVIIYYQQPGNIIKGKFILYFHFIDLIINLR